MLNTYTLKPPQHRRRVKRELSKSSPPANCLSCSSCHKREAAKLNVPQLHHDVKTAVWFVGILKAAQNYFSVSFLLFSQVPFPLLKQCTLGENSVCPSCQLPYFHQMSSDIIQLGMGRVHLPNSEMLNIFSYFEWHSSPYKIHNISAHQILHLQNSYSIDWDGLSLKLICAFSVLGCCLEENKAEQLSSKHQHTKLFNLKNKNLPKYSSLISHYKVPLKGKNARQQFWGQGSVQFFKCLEEDQKNKMTESHLNMFLGQLIGDLHRNLSKPVFHPYRKTSRLGIKVLKDNRHRPHTSATQHSSKIIMAKTPTGAVGNLIHSL